MGSENADSTRSDAGSGGNQRLFEWDGTVQPSTAVAEAVATVTDRRPTEIQPLHNSINTDALNRLVQHETNRTGNSISVSFRYEGVSVLVDSQNGITIYPGKESEIELNDSEWE